MAERMLEVGANLYDPVGGEPYNYLDQANGTGKDGICCRFVYGFITGDDTFVGASVWHIRIDLALNLALKCTGSVAEQN